jgi:hypothetical protein
MVDPYGWSLSWELVARFTLPLASEINQSLVDVYHLLSTPGFRVYGEIPKLNCERTFGPKKVNFYS